MALKKKPVTTREFCCGLFNLMSPFFCTLSLSTQQYAREGRQHFYFMMLTSDLVGGAVTGRSKFSSTLHS